MYLLDTDTLTRLHTGHSRVHEQLRRLGRTEVATSLVTRIELLRGRFEFLLKASNGDELLRAHRWLIKSETLLAEFPVFPPDRASAAIFDQLRTQRKLRKIGRADLLIGCIALARRATLVTRNVRHFGQIPGLTVVNWIDG